MRRTATLKPGNQLWGIYHADRECARLMGDPLHTVVKAPNKSIADEAAVELGFGDPMARRISSEEISHAQWLPKNRLGHMQKLAHKPRAASAL